MDHKIKQLLNKKFIALFISSLTFASCDRPGGEPGKVVSDAVGEPAAVEASPFEAQLIERFERKQREVEQITRRLRERKGSSEEGVVNAASI